MNSIQKAVNRAFVLSLILSIAIVAGIPAIIFGATNKWWILLALGITCSVIGFYCAPIAWTKYGELRNLARLVSAIAEEHIYTVQELAVHLSLTEKKVRKSLDKCFQKSYLQGYRRDKDKIILNEGTALEKTQFVAECPNCGAKFSYTRENPHCPYCNSPVVNNTH